MGYENNNCWKEIQRFFPVENRLNSNNMPFELFIEYPDVKIHVDYYQHEKPEATIILFHGIGGNGRMLSCIAVPLHRTGYDVICPDLPMYGYTEYKNDITYEHWVEYGVRITRHFNQSNTPLFLFGLSAGGMLAYQIACELNTISGILATCLLDQRNPVVTKNTAGNAVMGIMAKPLLRMFPNLFKSIKIPMKLVGNMRAITNNRELARILMKDKKSSGARVPLRFLDTLLHPEIIIEPHEFNKCPCLLLHPEKDRWTDVSLSKLFFDELQCQKELKILKGAGHFPIEYEGLKQLEEYCAEFVERYRE